MRERLRTINRFSDTMRRSWCGLFPQNEPPVFDTETGYLGEGCERRHGLQGLSGWLAPCWVAAFDAGDDTINLC